jgi:hypothetical protein
MRIIIIFLFFLSDEASCSPFVLLSFSLSLYMSVSNEVRQKKSRRKKTKKKPNYEMTRWEEV